MRLMPSLLGRIGPPSKPGKGVSEGVSSLRNLLPDRRQIRCTAKGQFVAIDLGIKL